MKRLMLIFSAILVLGAPLPLLAQAPPGPLQDDFYDWMTGKWEGATESPWGKANDEMEVDWDLEHQFLDVHYKSKIAETDPAKLEAMAKNAGMTKEQLQAPYKIKVMMTANPETKEYLGYLFDSYRAVATGKGTRDGNKMTMIWEGPMGNETRTIEKVSEDKLVMTFEGKDPQGNVMKGTTTMMRKTKKEKAKS
jgi:hypothetical protein